MYVFKVSLQLIKTIKLHTVHSMYIAFRNIGNVENVKLWANT